MSGVGSSNDHKTGHRRKSSIHHGKELQLLIGGPRRQTAEKNPQGIVDSGDPDDLDEPTPESKLIDFSSVFGPLTGRVEEVAADPIPKAAIAKGKKRGKKIQTRTAPEQRITIFALRLALLEKAASGLGKLSFLWATVVILGGFASTVTFTNFCVVTAIILAEGSRIFSRSHELEWQQLSVKSNIGGIPTGVARFMTLTVQSLKPNAHRGDLRRSCSPRPWFESAKSLSRRATPSDDSGSLSHNNLAAKAPVNAGSSHSLHSDQNAQKPGAETRTPTQKPGADARTPPSARSLAQLRRETTDIQRRTWSSNNLPLIPYMKSVSSTQVVSRILYYSQLGSAVVCIGLSIWRLVTQNFYKADFDENGKEIKLPNVTFSMNVFYVLGVLEAGLFLLERQYWEYRIRYKGLLEKVRKEARLGEELASLVKQFFYDVYAKCLEGSVFDGLEMDLVAYSISWLESEGSKQQYDGARLLNQFISADGKLQVDIFAADAMRRLGTTPGIIERLVEMLSWNSKAEEALLTEVASIVSSLVKYNRNCSRFVAVPGSTDAVVSLLLPSPGSAPGQTDPSDPSMQLRLTGLRTLKSLCKDAKNSLKIGETRNLLPVLILFIEVPQGRASFKEDKFTGSKGLKDRLKTYKKSLQVLLLLAAATNSSGGVLRKRIATVVSGLKNLRDVIQYASEQPELQRLAIEILFHIAMEEELRNIIGATGGVITHLFHLFTQWQAGGPKLPNDGESKPIRFRDDKTEQEKAREEQMAASEFAGQALTRLVLQNKANCKRLLQLRDRTNNRLLMPDLVNSLEKPDKFASSAANILRSVLVCADETITADIVQRCGPLVLGNTLGHCNANVIVKSEKYEASLGLAAQILPLVDEKTYQKGLECVKKDEFLHQLVKSLRHAPTTIKYPAIRRYTVELIIAIIDKDDSFVDCFQEEHRALVSILEKTLDTISEVENYCLFSGSLGFTRHSVEMEDLVTQCIVKVIECQTKVSPSFQSSQ